MFDLPTLEPNQRREANRYRDFLFDQGFQRVQLSVYSRYMINATSALPLIEILKASVPDQGYVRMMQISDRQWAGGWRLYGKNYEKPEDPPEQILLF